MNEWMNEYGREEETRELIIITIIFHYNNYNIYKGNTKQSISQSFQFVAQTTLFYYIRILLFLASWHFYIDLIGPVIINRDVGIWHVLSTLFLQYNIVIFTLNYNWKGGWRGPFLYYFLLLWSTKLQTEYSRLCIILLCSLYVSRKQSIRMGMRSENGNGNISFHESQRYDTEYDTAAGYTSSLAMCIMRLV